MAGWEGGLERCCGRDGACFRPASASGVSLALGVAELAPHSRNRGRMRIQRSAFLGREWQVK
jgi:hypothetical protein